MYGISQNPDTNDYILVFQDLYCERCGNQYTDINSKWCKPCHLYHFKNSYANWTSKNEKIDNIIQEMQLKINQHHDLVFEWIPHDQFKNIKKIGEDDFATVYSAVWKDGPLCYNKYIDTKYIRSSNKKVALKRLYNSQDNTDELLNEV